MRSGGHGVRRLAATNTLADIEVVADARRPLLTYAALVLEHIIRVAKPKTIVFSTFGVREGLLHEKLSETERNKDGLICAAEELNQLLSRSARHAACLLSDIGWRVHPDHRGEQTLSLVVNGNFGAITHIERAFVGLSVFYRYAGLSEENQPPLTMQELLTPAQLERARLLGAA